MTKYQRKFLLSIIGGLIVLCCFAVWHIFVYFDSLLMEDEKVMKEKYSEWFQIPSNGNGELFCKLEISNFQNFKNLNESAFGNISDSCLCKEDTYYVYNYNPKDSMFMFRIIDSINIDTSLQKHVLKFYLHTEPRSLYSKYCYWRLEYYKKEYDTLYHVETGEMMLNAINKQLTYIRFPEFNDEYRHNRSEHHEFVYDEKKKHFCPVKRHESFYYHKKKEKRTSDTIDFFY